MFSHRHKNFDHEKFKEELKRKVLLAPYFELFHVAFKLILNQLTPLEQKIVRSNN